MEIKLGVFPNTATGVTTAKADIAKARKALNEYEDSVTRFADGIQKLSPVQKLAIEMHNKFCTWDHTSGCGWFYGMKDGLPTWERDDQITYLRKAEFVAKKARQLNIRLEDVLELVVVF